MLGFPHKNILHHKVLCTFSITLHNDTKLSTNMKSGVVQRSILAFCIKIICWSFSRMCCFFLCVISLRDNQPVYSGLTRNVMDNNGGRNRIWQPVSVCKAA